MPASAGTTVVTVTLWLKGLVQLGEPAVVTLTKAMVVSTAYVLAKVAVPDASNTIVWFAPLLIVNVTIASGVPVIVTVTLSPEHAVVGDRKSVV